MTNALAVTTIYADSAIGLTVQAWPRNAFSWYVLFRVKDQYSMPLHETAVFYMYRRLTEWHQQPAGGWASHAWQPVGYRMVPSSALAAVEAWLTKQKAAA